jgi:hypothetical protein
MPIPSLQDKGLMAKHVSKKGTIPPPRVDFISFYLFSIRIIYKAHHIIPLEAPASWCLPKRGPLHLQGVEGTWQSREIFLPINLIRCHYIYIQEIEYTKVTAG